MKLTWPVGWNIQTFHMAMLAERQHRLPDFCADVAQKVKFVRTVIGEVEALSERLGHYIFDHHAKPEAWQPAPYTPRAARESLEKVYVRDFRNPARIKQLMSEGHGAELLLTRACVDCDDMIVVTVETAAQAIEKFNLDRYTPPGRCYPCKRARQKRRSQGPLRVPVREHVKQGSADPPAKPVSEEAPLEVTT